MISFTVNGIPQGKARARVGKGFSYTPEKTVLYENLIKLCYQKEHGNKQFNTISNGDLKQPLMMDIKAFYPIPKSYTKGKRLLAEQNIIKPTKKPDADNIAKVVCDALNGVAYIDDTQIVKLSVTKEYSHNPRVVVSIDCVESEESNESINN